MKIGITYDLKSEYLTQGFSSEQAGEFDLEETIDAIETSLLRLGYETQRIGNARQLADALAKGGRWDLVFNICEGLYGFGREAQVPAILDLFHIPCTFSGVLALSLALHKGFTKRVIRDAGIATAGFVLVSKEEDLSTVDLPFPLFVKPVAEGSGKGIGPGSKVHGKVQLRQRCLHIIDTFGQPALVETFLPGREYTVGLTGTGDEAAVLGVMEVSFAEKAGHAFYSFHTKQEYETLVQYRLVHDLVAQECAALALKAWKVLLGRDAGRIDLRLDGQGRPHFIEVNPLAGLHPLHSDLVIMASLKGMSYTELIALIMKSALARVHRTQANSGIAMESSAVP